jgi:hypothetical protein
MPPSQTTFVLFALFFVLVGLALGISIGRRLLRRRAVADLSATQTRLLRTIGEMDRWISRNRRLAQELETSLAPCRCGHQRTAEPKEQREDSKSQAGGHPPAA